MEFYNDLILAWCYRRQCCLLGVRQIDSCWEPRWWKWWKLTKTGTRENSRSGTSATLGAEVKVCHCHFGAPFVTGCLDITVESCVFLGIKLFWVYCKKTILVVICLWVFLWTILQSTWFKLYLAENNSSVTHMMNLPYMYLQGLSCLQSILLTCEAYQYRFVATSNDMCLYICNLSWTQSRITPKLFVTEQLTNSISNAKAIQLIEPSFEFSVSRVYVHWLSFTFLFYNRQSWWFTDNGWEAEDHISWVREHTCHRVRWTCTWIRVHQTVHGQNSW